MKLGEKTEFGLLGELLDFEVGKEIDQNNIKLYPGGILGEYKVSEAIQKVDFKEDKTYPIKDTQLDIKGVESDRFKVDGLSYPIFVACIENGNELKYMYNSKSSLSYSNHFRKLDKKVDKWYIGYLKELELSKAAFETTEIPYISKNSHIIDIIKNIEDLNLNFSRTPKTIYDIAELIQDGVVKFEDLNQEKLNTL